MEFPQAFSLETGNVRIDNETGVTHGPALEAKGIRPGMFIQMADGIRKGVFMEVASVVSATEDHIVLKLGRPEPAGRRASEMNESRAPTEADIEWALQNPGAPGARNILNNS